VTTTGRGFQTRDAEMNLARMLGDLAEDVISDMANVTP
jgi:hypothetical protein